MNVFLKYKKMILQIARANKVQNDVAASMASSMADQKARGEELMYSLEGVEGFTSFATEVATLSQDERQKQFAEYNKAYTQDSINGNIWTLDNME